MDTTGNDTTGNDTTGNDTTDSPLVAPPGLKGLVVADTTIGSVRGAEGFYHYRQYDAVEIARNHSFEAAAALLVDGELPDGDGEASFRAQLAAARHIEPAAMSALATIAPIIDSPLGGLRAAISMLVPDDSVLDLSPGERRAHGLRVAAAAPTVMAALYRLGHGAKPLVADAGLGHATDYVRLVTGVVPSPPLARAVETYLTLTADHGFNASTFTARVVASTGAGVGSILAAAVGALSGPLHGGAPGRVLDMIGEIGDPANTEAWATPVLEAGRPVMGFGHAVYRADDPRSALLREVALGLGGDLVAQAEEIESRMLRLLQGWKPEATIVTNVEFYAAVVLHLAGIPQSMFTATFTTSRVIGWVAHLLEQSADNKIMRPAARYVGPEPKRVAVV